MFILVYYIRFKYKCFLHTELHAFCNSLGCTCATGYTLVQSSRGIPICRKAFAENNDQKEQSQLHDEDQCGFFTVLRKHSEIEFIFYLWNSAL